MTKLTPNSLYRFVLIEGRDNVRHWVLNKNFSVHLNDKVVISDRKGVIAFVRVIRRTSVKPIKGEPIWHIVATDNQFPVAENEQVVACNHVAPAPMSSALIKEDLKVIKIEINESEYQIRKAKANIDKLIEELKNG